MCFSMSGMGGWWGGGSFPVSGWWKMENYYLKGTISFRM